MNEADIARIIAERHALVRDTIQKALADGTPVDAAVEAVLGKSSTGAVRVMAAPVEVLPVPPPAAPFDLEALKAVLDASRPEPVIVQVGGEGRVVFDRDVDTGKIIGYHTE